MSPLARFPPPLPAHRRTLRERCSAELNLRIMTNVGPFQQQRPFQQQPPPCQTGATKGHVQPHRSHLPRRRKNQVKRIVFYDSEDRDKPDPDAGAAPNAPDCQQQGQERHLQKLFEGLALAFKLQDPRADADACRDEGYTHIVDICHAEAPPASAHGCGAIERLQEAQVQRLRLILPAVAGDSPAPRAGLSLSDAQIRAARDFIAKTLPYASASQGKATAPLTASVLISTPAGRPTDAMSVLGCYLSFVSGKPVEITLRVIDDTPEILSAWKGEVSGDEVDRLEQVAARA
ncbi:hypothetical protein WOLCODRAFT_126086 [Wolfiporia cocos MD-104 SS10]|uniref:Uncharacterized protein n=1 Tax=Wolfiporia cocos (strain MD-104) TaxID=742152 RepID=A0A2H3J0Z3_WOLCO|nr:hypothetical protein WOLCODRAFT_126086 [Wolfiporia cocos MD-104 SS10]